MMRSIMAIVVSGIILCGSGTRSAAAIIADHTVVDRYDDIPQYYIDLVKKMWVSIAGESHSLAYRKGCSLLQSIDSRFMVSVRESGTPDAATDQNLRLSRATWGDYGNATGWMYGYGEEDWYTNATAVSRTKNGLLYCDAHDMGLAVIGFGWCWDMSWLNGPGGTTDPVYQVQWAGSSVNGPEGNLRWGLDAADSALTGNSVCLDTYLDATQQYIDYCAAQGIATKPIFTTGPQESGGESGYQIYLKQQRIRAYVNADPDNRILFDYADILCWNDAGNRNTATWTDRGGTPQTFDLIHSSNMVDLNGSYAEDGDHIGERGALRVGKAMWWMLARIAGWDGVSSGPPDLTAPSAPQNLAASTVSSSRIDLTWTASTDNVGVTGYAVYCNSTFLSSATATSFSSTGRSPSTLYAYKVRAYDAAGNKSDFSAEAQATTSAPPDPGTGAGTAAEPATLRNVSTFPSPFRSGAPGITFTNLPRRAVIRIWSLSGDLLFEYPKDDSATTFLWTTANSNGKQVASGLYLYSIVDSDYPQCTAKGKVVIIR